MKKIIILILFPLSLFANNLEPHKKICADIGFTEGTEEYAECVMDFFKQAKNNQKNQSDSTTKNYQNENSNDATAKALELQNRILQNQLNFEKQQAEKKRKQDQYKKVIDLLFPPQVNCYGNGYNTTCYKY